MPQESLGQLDTPKHLISDASHISWSRKQLVTLLEEQKRMAKDAKKKKRTTPGISRWSPTRVLVWRLSAYLWESGRDPEFSNIYGRTWKKGCVFRFITLSPDFVSNPLRFEL